MPQPDKLRVLYDALNNQYDLGTFDEFKAKMQDEKKRRTFYDGVSGAYDLGTFDEFNGKIASSFATAQPATQSQGTVATVDNPVENSQQQQPEQPKWTPTPVQRMGMQMQLDEISRRSKQTMDDFNESMENMRSVHPLTMQGKPRVKFNSTSGKVETTYGALDGRSYSSPELAQQASRKHQAEWVENWENTTEEGRQHRERRIQQQEQDFQDFVNGTSLMFRNDRNNAAEKAWSDAAERTAATNEASANKVYGGDPWLNGGREMHIVNASLYRNETRANYLREHDLDKLFDEAWSNLGEDGQANAIEDAFLHLKSHYPGADEQQLQQAARELARQQSDRRMYYLAVQKNLPKSNLEYLARKIMQGNTIYQISEGFARSKAGTTGDIAAVQHGEQIFKDNGGFLSSATNVGGTVAGFILDPLTILTAGAGSTAAKGATWLGGKWLAGRGATSLAVEAATRKFSTSIGGRILTGMAAGAGNFGTYEFAKEGVNQWQWGGHINPATGENEGYSFGAMMGAGGHGLMMGAATGWIAPAAAPLSQRLTQATTSTAGKIGVNAGMFGGTVLTEGTIFSIPEWIEGERDAWDVWTDNQAMMLGFKGQHLLKSAFGVLGDMAASRDGRVGFETRLRARLDGHPELRLTEDEQRELDAHGYGDLKELVADKELVDKANANRAPSSHTTEIARQGEVKGDRAEWISRLQEMMQDNSISEAARAKMYYLATGRRVPMSTVVSGSIEQDGDGYIVNTYGVNGVITSRRHKTKRGAEAEMERVGRQMEFNYVAAGEKYKDWVGTDELTKDAVEAVIRKHADELGVYDNAELLRRYKMYRDIEPEERSEAEQRLVDVMDNALNERKDKFGAKAVREDINKKYGVDIDNVLAKEPNRRSKNEQAVLEEYVRSLYPDGAFDQQADAAGDGAPDPTQPINPDQAQLTQQPTERTPYERGRNAQPEERRDIVLDMQQRGDEEAQEAYNGMVDRINDDAENEVQRLWGEYDDMRHNDGTMRPATLKLDDKPIYIVDGNVQMMEDGSIVDLEHSDKTVVVFNPETGKREMISPEAILSIDEPMSGEDIEAMIEQHRADFIQKAVDEANGTLALVPGDIVDLQTEDGGLVQGQILANDGQGGLIVALQDGTQMNVEARELQRVADDIALADYKQRKGIVDEAPAAQEVEQPVMEQGAPRDYAPDTEIVIRDEDGQEKRGIVQGRVRYDAQTMQFIPDPDGQMIEYYVEGEGMKHDYPDRLDDKVVSYTAAEKQTAEPSATVAGDTQPVGTGVLGCIFNQFKGKAKQAVDFLRRRKEGVAEGALHHKDIGDIDLAWGDERSGLAHILDKHPEVADDLQGVIDGMAITSQSDNRIVLESGTHKAVVSKMKGNQATPNWLLTAYEKKKSVSASSSDIETEPEGKQNGTATLQSGLSAGKGSDIVGTVQENGEKIAGAMPMTADEEPDYYAVDPSRAHLYIYNEAGLSRSEANEHVMANYEQAQKDLTKAKATPMPKMGTSIKKFNEAKAQRQQKIDEVEKRVEYWQAVREQQQQIAAAENAERAAREAELHDAAVAQALAEREAARRAEAERKAVGNENPMPAITEKWNTATKTDGVADEIVLPNGKRVSGHYVLHESGASSPSHQATAGWKQTDGFPMDVNDNTVNDRDYEHDPEAQNYTRDIAQNFDQRALQTPVVVSKDGVVLSGNGRTMAGELAAKAGTDGAYIDYLKKYAHKYGFTPEQVEAMEHPRVSFVPDEDMPYTADTFSAFNQQEMKSMSKTEQSVKLGKTVPDDTFRKVLGMMNGFDTLGDFYNDVNASFNAVALMNQAGVIPQAQMAEMTDGHKLSAVGREMLENMLIGKSFENNPDVVRMLTSVPSMRQSVIFALAEISNNIGLGEEFSLESELADAIKLCYEARTVGKYEHGEQVSGYARQLNLFAFEDEMQTVADINNATILMLADVLNDRRVSQLKRTLALYNDNAASSAAGQAELFSGGVRGKEEILKDVLTFLNYGTKKDIEATQQAAIERRKAEAQSVQQDGVVEPSNQGERGQYGETSEKPKVDENGIAFASSPDGSTIFGEIREESGLTPAPIKLSTGRQDEDGKGYGLAHIEANHGRQIRDAGFSSVEEFVSFVAKNYDEDNIKVGKRRNSIPTYLIQITDEHDNTLFIELSKDGSYWNVNSGGIFRKGYSNKKETVAKTEPQQPDNAVPNGSSLSESREGGIMPSEPNGEPTVSDGKGTDNSERQQGNDAKSLPEHTNKDGLLINSDGTAMTLYHGTGNKEVTGVGTLEAGHRRADGSKAVFNGEGIASFTPRKDVALDYSNGREEGVLSVNITLKKPCITYGVANMDEKQAHEFTERLKAEGYDGIINYSSLQMREIGDLPVEVIPFDKKAISEVAESIAPRTEGYSMEKRTDTRDGSDIYAVKFEERVSRDEFKGQKEIAKRFGGYWSNFGKKGFLFKSEEAAHDFAETVMGRSVEEVEDEAPITINDVAAVNGGEKPTHVEEVEAEEASWPKEQFAKLKAKHPDALILFHDGEGNYAAYEEDAENLSSILGMGVAHQNDGSRLAGFPTKALDAYLRRIIRAKQRVAIVEALDDPNTNGETRKVIEGIKPGVQYRFVDENGRFEPTAEQRLAGEAVVELLKGAGIEVSMDAEEMRRVLEDSAGRMQEMAVEEANSRFNEQLEGLTEENAQNIRLLLGTPSAILQSTGIADKPLLLYGNKVIKKAEKHGFSPSDLRNLPKAVQSPIAVFAGNRAGSHAILTELRVGDNNILVSLEVGKGNDVDFNIITSTYGKSENGIVNWINRGKLLYADKEKTLDYLRISAPIAEAQSNQELVSAAKVVESFENPKVSEEILQKMTVWHGSPYSFEAFDHANIGKGEGAQVHGWGTYVTESSGTAKRYATLNEPFSRATYKGEVKPSGKVRIDNLGLMFADKNKQEVIDFINQSIANQKDKSIADVMREELEFVKKTDESDWEIDTNGRSHMYEVEIPEDDGTNYIDEDKTYSWTATKKLFKRVGLDASEYFVDKSTPSGRELYNAIASELGNAEKASKALSQAGFAGIKYDGRQDGGCYVIFNEADAKIKNHVQFLKTARGEVYGFVKDGKVYLDPALLNPETPIHEYSHLWDNAVRVANPELWSKGVELMKAFDGGRLWDEVVNDPNYADIAHDENLVASEVKARLTGERGAEYFERAAKEAAKGNGMFDQAEKFSVIAKVKDWLKDIWKATKEWLKKSAFGERWSKDELDRLTAEDFADMTLRDLMEGVNPRDEARKVVQSDIIQKTSPAEDDYHTWIRKPGDVKSFREMLNEAERDHAEYGGMVYPDMTIGDLRKAKDSGYITVYSSKPIKDGVFVTPSRMNAKDYAGGGKVYSKRVSVDDVAWIGQDEGQLAQVSPESRPMQMRFIGEKGASNSKDSENGDIQGEVELAAEKLHLGNMEVVTDTSGLKGRRSKDRGWYDTKTGKIVIVLPNHADTRDAVRTLLHEGVAHHGLREMFGEHFYEYLDDVYKNADEGIRKTINDRAGSMFLGEIGKPNGKTYEECRREATEEYMADMAENIDFGSMKESLRQMWHNIKSLFRELLKKVGIKTGDVVTDNDLRYTLWRSHKNLTSRGRDYVGMAEDVVKDAEMREELGINKGKPTLLDAVNTLYQQGKEAASKLYQRSFFDVAKTPDFMKEIGLTGDKFTVRYGVIARHFGKDSEHDLPSSVWEQLPEALQKPFAITKYFADDEKKQQKGYRLYTTLQLPNGSYVVVSAEVKNAGKDIEVNAINTVFGRDAISKTHDEIVYVGENITPEQQALLDGNNPHQYPDIREENASEQSSLLGGRNSHQYPTIQELNSAAKVVNNSESGKRNGGKVTQTAESEGADNGLLFRSPSSGGVPGSARAEYERKVREPNVSGSVGKMENFLWRFKKNYADSMAALKALQEAVLNETGNTMRGGEDAYKAENRMASANKAQEEAYERDFFNPLKEAVHAVMTKLAETIGENGKPYDEVKRYLVAKHGLERNEVLAQRDFDAYQKEHPTGTKTLADFRERDYSGLTGLTGTDNVADAEAEARKMVADFEGKVDTTELWEKINAATKETLAHSWNHGLMSGDTYRKVRDMFQWYIPLRGWDSNVAADEYNYYGSRNTMTGAPLLKTAKGRTSVAEDPIAHIGHMASRAIVQGNRNKMKHVFLNFVLKNPTSLTSVGEQWYVETATGEWIPSDPVIPADADGATVESLVKAHEASMKSLEASGKASRMRDGLHLNLHATTAEQNEHKVRVQIGDMEKVIYINGNPAAAQALNGLTNPDVHAGTVEKFLSKWKGIYSGLLTSLNLAFVGANLSMDAIQCMAYTATRENGAYNRQAWKNAGKVFGTAMLPRLIHKWKSGTLDETNETERYFREFMMNGGETGFTQLLTVDDYKKNIDKFMKEAEGGVARMPKKAWDAVWDGVEFLNRCAEDTNRFICYMTSRQMGRDVAQSIWDAKEISVNFSKKGAGGMGARQLNFMYVFFNAAIQALRGFAGVVGRNPKKATAMLSTLAASGFVVPMLNALMISLCKGLMGDDDDKDADWYGNLPEWERRNNICLYIPFTKGAFFKIPIAHELRGFYGAGECAWSAMTDRQDLGSAMGDAIDGFTTMLPVDYTGNGGNVALNLTPSIAQPVAQIVANKDFFGKPVYRDSPFKKLDPEYTKAYKGTAGWLVDGSELINRLSGGDAVKKGKMDGLLNNPDVIEHLLYGYFGGPAKLIVQTGKTVQMLWDEDARMWRNVPVGSRFVTQADERSRDMNVNGRYWEYIDGEYAQVEHDKRGYEKQKKMGAMEYAEKLDALLESPTWKRYQAAHGYKKAIDKLRKALKTADATNAEQIDTRILELKREMFEKLDSISAVEK